MHLHINHLFHARRLRVLLVRHVIADTQAAYAVPLAVRMGAGAVLVVLGTVQAFFSHITNSYH